MQSYRNGLRGGGGDRWSTMQKNVPQGQILVLLNSLFNPIDFLEWKCKLELYWYVDV